VRRGLLWGFLPVVVVTCKGPLGNVATFVPHGCQPIGDSALFGVLSSILAGTAKRDSDRDIGRGASMALHSLGLVLR
jgi:hypothetical protein